jgi:hypothetical protein
VGGNYPPLLYQEVKMFIEAITSVPKVVDGRVFIEKTLKGKYKGSEITATTIFMDGKPILKQYFVDGEKTLRNVTKRLNKKPDVEDITVNKLDITI